MDKKQIVRKVRAILPYGFTKPYFLGGWEIVSSAYHRRYEAGNDNLPGFIDNELKALGYKLDIFHARYNELIHSSEIFIKFSPRCDTK